MFLIGIKNVRMVEIHNIRSFSILVSRSPIFFRVVVILLTILSSFFIAQEAMAAGQISGVMYSEFYHVFRHHDPHIEGQNGFWFRRIYFTYSDKLSEKLSMRLRLEMASSGDFRTKSSLTPFVKDAYLSYSIGKHTAMFGIIGTPTWGDIENFWGYRAVGYFGAGHYTT